MASTQRTQKAAYFATLNEGQREAFEKVVVLLRLPRRSLCDYHATALAMAELRPAEGGYGSGTVRQLCNVLASEKVTISASLVYRLLKFAKLFPNSKGKRQIREYNETVSWDSMMRILHIKVETQQMAVLKMASSQSLSTRAVRKLIVEKAYRRPHGGRPPAGAEEHPNRALKSLLAFTAKWPVVTEAWLDKKGAASEMASRLNAESVSDEFLEDMTKAADFVANMTRSTKKLSTKLSALLRKLRRK
jgi:hypothetical protein